MMVGSKEAAPLWITPLLNYQKEELESGHYETIQRLISPSPNPDNEESEIETAVESFIGPGGSALWRRVVVRSGPSCPKQAVHASYMLPNDAGSRNLSSGPIVCWTAFPERPDHDLLCVLGSPTLLCIWDVYPKGKEADLGGEGHSIPLPFEACGIHAIEGGHGLLLQRTETLEDNLAFDAQNRTWTSTGLQGEDEDDGFVLKAPPRTVRLRESTGTSLGSLNMAASNSAVPSLFSLSHPLDDILPVTNFPDVDMHVSTFADVFEKILFVGEVKWTNPNEAVIDRKEQSQSICVTYHTHRKRHAIWEIKKSPPPPPQAPLWQVSSQWRSEKDWSSHLGGLQQDLEDLELLGSPDVDTSTYEAASRNEALADALGVRKTPRKAMDEGAPRVRSVAARSHRKSTLKAAANLSLLSPSSRPTNETMMEVDTSVESVAKAPMLSLGPFASLHPEIAMTCIYEEVEIMPQASNVFLVSNMEGSGILTLCLVCPNDDPINPNQVRLFDFQSSENSYHATDLPSFGAVSKTFEVIPRPSVPCISATPLNSSPIPGCFLPHRRNTKGNSKPSATDMFLLHANKKSQRKLSLYRNSMHIVDCSMRDEHCESNSIIVNIGNSVGSKVDITLKTGGKEACIRTCISLTMESTNIGEKVIQALESTLCSPSFLEACPKGIGIALKLRADCIRMEHSLLESSKERSALVEDVGSTAVGTVLFAMFVLELLGQDVNHGNALTEVSPNIKKSAWDQLLGSEYHESHTWKCQDFLFLDPKTSSNVSKDFGILSQHLGWNWNHLSGIHSFAVERMKSLGSSISMSLFDALHALYEEFKLHSNSRDAGLRCIGTVLCQVCLIASSETMASKYLFLEHYKQDLGDAWFQRIKSSMESVATASDRNQIMITSYDLPPCILSWVDSYVSGKDIHCGFNSSDPSLTNATCTRIHSLFRIFTLLYGEENSSESQSKSRRNKDHEVVKALIEEGFVDKDLLRDDLPAGVALPLLEVLYRCRSDNEKLTLSHEDAKMWSLIGREDLCKNAQKSGKGMHLNESAVGSISLDLSKGESSQMEDKDSDGVCPLEVTSSMLFPNDNRIREVGRLLRSSRPTYLNVPRAIEVSDHDYERLKQEKLLFLSRRVLALPVGRGMFTIGNLQPVPAEPLPLPDISLVGRVPPTNAMLALDTTDCPSDLKVWPEFHNGVAAGLRLPLEAEAGEIVSKITRTWIVYNRPDESVQSQNNSNSSTNPPPSSPIHAYGGLLMALGLRGHLTTLEMTDIFDYLTQGTVTTTVGVLLGMAVNMRGTCDISVSKMLCLHIPSLIPQHFSAIDVASPVQAAAVAGAGLLYQGSSHRMMTEFLLNEIGKRPSSDLNVFDREAYTLSCGFALGMVNLCKGDGVKGDTAGGGNAGLSDLRIEERLYRYVVGGLDDAEMRGRREDADRFSMPSTSAANGNERCSCIHEGDSINTDITAPGATLALGLIYMKSGNKTIASALALPDTHFLLEYVRPDFLMLRVIARALILWDDVQPSKSWIKSQLPKAVDSAYSKMRALAQNMSQQTANPTFIDDDKEFDRQAIRLIYTHVIAGACFAIGLRYAGTGNREAAAAIFECVMELRDLRDGIDPVSCALRPQGPVLEMCLGCAAVSLSMVLAGSGDLEVLRLLKVLRWRCDEEVTYGSHLAYGTAIGLLFLGGGTCTLGREPEDIAAMLMAFYPRFPTTTSDNQYHLQALRNLYAIAVKHREFRAVDVDTGESVYVPIQVHFEDDSVAPLELTAPCLLFNTDVKPKELRVVSERYYPVTLSIDNPTSRKIFFVKRRSAHLSYLQDPHSQRSLLVQTGSFQGYTSLDLIASFTDDQKVLAFAKHLCDVGHGHSKTTLPGPFSVAGFCSRVLHECLLLDSEEALPLYLALRSAISSVQAGVCSAVSYVWDFRIIRAYYEQRHRIVPDNSPRLLNSEIIAYLCELLENSMLGGGGTNAVDKSVLSDGSVAVYFDQPTRDTANSMDLS